MIQKVIYKTNRLTDIENKLMALKGDSGEQERGDSGELGIWD